MRLVEDTPERPDRNFVLPRHDRRICALSRNARELDVNSFLADLLKTCRFKATLDLAKTERLKPA